MDYTRTVRSGTSELSYFVHIYELTRFTTKSKRCACSSMGLRLKFSRKREGQRNCSVFCAALLILIVHNNIPERLLVLKLCCVFSLGFVSSVVSSRATMPTSDTVSRRRVSNRWTGDLVETTFYGHCLCIVYGNTRGR